jgi:hypothetical protein
MSFLTHVANRGTTKTASNATTIVRTLADEIVVGRVVIVRVGNRNADHPSDTATGETSKHSTLVDSVGNTYTKIAERSHPSAAFEPGLAVSVWYTVTTVAIPIGGTITCTFDTSRRGRMINVQEYSLEEEGSVLNLLGYTTNSARSTNPTVTHTETADEITWLGTGLNTNRTVGALTVDSTFTSDLTPNILDNGNDDSATMWGQYRQLFTDTEIWNHLLNESSLRWCCILAAFTVSPPPPGPAVEGTREYQDDFETDGHETLATSTSRRPDAISRDYQQARCMGPVAINDASEGIEARRWHVRTDGTNVYVRRSNAGNTAWEDDTLLFSVTGGEAINEIDVAFNIDGRITVWMERPNGTGGVAHVSVYRWHAGSSTYQIKSVADGSSPRAIDDYFVFPYTAPWICPPEVYVQCFYMKPGAGLKRRSEIDDWNTDFDTVVTALSTRRCEEVVKTVDHRIRWYGSRRNTATGRYTIEWADSLPYRDSEIRRPLFVNWTDPAFDLFRRGNSFRSNPPSGTVTEDYQLRIQVQDDCDAIEIGCIGDFPFGSEPAFDVQEQESTNGGLGFDAGNVHDFTIEVTHGSSTTSVVAVRARIRRTIGEVTCYSPWRYTVFPADWSIPAPEDEPVNCGYDLMVDIDHRMLWQDHGLTEGVRNTTANSGGPCDDPLKTFADTNPGGEYAGWWFVGGELNTGPSFPFPTHFVRFSVRSRPWALLDFVDEDGIRHNGFVIGEVMETTAGDAPDKDYDWSSSRFPTQFPLDTGLYPTIPDTIDIIRSQ